MAFITIKLKKDQLDNLFKAIEERGLVRVSKFGAFTLKRMKPRRFYHNFSDKQIVTGGRNKLHFRPFVKTKEKIQEYKNYHNV